MICPYRWIDNNIIQVSLTISNSWQYFLHKPLKHSWRVSHPKGHDLILQEVVRSHKDRNLWCPSSQGDLLVAFEKIQLGDKPTRSTQSSNLGWRKKKKRVRLSDVVYLPVIRTKPQWRIWLWHNKQGELQGLLLGSVNSDRLTTSLNFQLCAQITAQAGKTEGNKPATSNFIGGSGVSMTAIKKNKKKIKKYLPPAKSLPNTRPNPRLDKRCAVVT